MTDTKHRNERIEQYMEQIRQQFEGKRAGMFASVFRGSGIEIADFRKRQAGDQQKRVNRKLSAKHDQLRVNEYDADRTIDVEIFLDINQNRCAGIEQENSELVLLALTDFLVYAKKHQLHCTLSWRGNELRMYKISYDVQQLRMIFQQFIADIDHIKKTSSGYVSYLHRYLQAACEKRKKRICLLRSDFLDRNTQDAAHVEYLHDMHVQMFGVRVPIDKHFGENYTARNRKDRAENISFEIITL